MFTKFHRFLLSILYLIVFSLGSIPISNASPQTKALAQGSIRFEEVSNKAGISYVGASYGAAWGDFNGDDLPDLWVTNHTNPGTLYQNQGDGTFTDMTEEVFLPSEVFPRVEDIDHHGAAWADFDNDGDQDLVQLVGGNVGVGSLQDIELFNQFWVNNAGKLESQASKWGIEHPGARGRTPLWLDFDNDGLLDLISNASLRPDNRVKPTIFQQRQDVFKDASSQTGFHPISSLFAFQTDLSVDGNLELVIVRKSPANSPSIFVYDKTSIPFKDVTTSLISDAVNNPTDITVADFNGDLLPDMYLTQSTKSPDLIQDWSHGARMRFIVNGSERGAQLSTTGKISICLGPLWSSLSSSDINIGKQGIHPTNNECFTLSPENPSVEGILPHVSGSDRGIYIGYDSILKRWELNVSIPERKIFAISFRTTEPISQLIPIGFDPANNSLISDKLLINTEKGLLDRSKEAGIDNIPNTGKSVVAGDFDNDMDQDIYIVNTSAVGNRPNVLYANQGNGTFVAVEVAGGAIGPIPDLSSTVDTALGVGDSVTIADYDLDGFLDLFVTNGEGPFPLHDGNNKLYHNQGNENHWLEIDLQGTISNRDGIGSKVFVTAGGITQLREQSGGIHSKSQNHQRLHFGLAGNTIIEKLEVRWPSGLVQELMGIPANQLIQIIEPSKSL
ncbi:MAG: CRTAC1 family protein [Cyanobacteria bacterium J06635_10]